MSEQSSKVRNAVNQIAAKLAAPLATAGARIILTLLTLIAAFAWGELRELRKDTEGLGNRLLTVETERRTNLAHFTKRVDDIEAQNRREIETQGAMQTAITRVAAELTAVRDGVQRIERFIDAQRAAAR